MKINQFIDHWIGSPPIVYYRLQKTMNKFFNQEEDASFLDFEEIIEGDPGLSARLLKIVNSPFYGLESQVKSIAHAISIIGAKPLADLALSTEVQNIFQGIEGDLINLDAFWKHSVACGLGARLLGDKVGEKEVETLYLAGLLHDLGTLIFFKVAPDKSRTVLQGCREKQISKFVLEKEVFGFNHAQVGAALFKEWKLPANLVIAVGYHHDPLGAKMHSKLAAIVHVSDWLAYELNLGTSGEPVSPDLNPKALEWIGLPEAELTTIQGQLGESFNRFYQDFIYS